MTPSPSRRFKTPHKVSPALKAFTTETMYKMKDANAQMSNRPDPMIAMIFCSYIVNFQRVSEPTPRNRIRKFKTQSRFLKVILYGKAACADSHFDH